jgi:hypothetical protein
VGERIVIKWGAITFAVGMLLIVVEIFMARRKKGGITPTDKKSMIGLFWLSIFASLLVMSLVYMA